VGPKGDAAAQPPTVAVGPTVAPDRVSRRQSNRLISIRQSGRYQPQTPLAQRAPGELRVPDRRWPQQLFVAAGEMVVLVSRDHPGRAADIRPVPPAYLRAPHLLAGALLGDLAVRQVGDLVPFGQFLAPAQPGGCWRFPVASCSPCPATYATPRQSPSSAGGGSPGSGRTCKDDEEEPAACPPRADQAGRHDSAGGPRR
jgi:hypothetical protein